jgi:hypothetical protein
MRLSESRGFSEKGAQEEAEVSMACPVGRDCPAESRRCQLRRRVLLCVGDGGV